AIHEALQFARSVPAERQDELARYFWAELKEAIPELDVAAIQKRSRAAAPAEETTADPLGSPFYIESGRIYPRTHDREGRENGGYALCNFVARISEETILDDGSGENDLQFTIAGTLYDGTPLPPARVRATEFAGLRWVVRDWGVKAIIKAGQGSQDQL